MAKGTREKLVLIGMYLAFATIISRLFYWQMIKGSSLEAAAANQYERTFVKTGSRGKIFTSDGYSLVSNRLVYRLFAQPALLEHEPGAIASQLVPLLTEDLADFQAASSSAELKAITESLSEDLTSRLSKTDSRWVSLRQEISAETKAKIEALKIVGVGFDQYEKRYYPEASMAAHVTGFVGKDSEGFDIGYFGLEGALEKELQARSSKNTVITDAFGRLLIGDPSTVSYVDGRDITTTIRRDVQFAVERGLQSGMEKYGAKSGEIIVMDPKTGEILGMASYPHYDQLKFFEFEPELYKNPSISNLYEPGSTFKVLTVAAAIDSGKISPETVCPKCSGPRTFGKYTIRTWNDVYNPDINMRDALAKSDNTAMIYAAELIGHQKFQEYIKAFGIGDPLGLELQEDTRTPFPDQWNDVRLATTSFGQGILTNSLQMVRAVSAIANGGVMMKPIIVSEVHDTSTGEVIKTPIKEERRVVSVETAQEVTKMMIHAAQSGEAQWIASKTHTIAGKTGTSQIAVSGGYAEDKTIASFIGFAPPDNPKFIMLVKFTEPQSSPWAAETAAPLWYEVAKELYLLLKIPPDRESVSSR